MRRYQCRGTTYFRRAIEKMLWPRNHLFGSRIGFASFDVLMFRAHRTWPRLSSALH
jgi:hypothetical protein